MTLKKEKVLLPQDDISMFSSRELLSRLLAPVRSDVCTAPAEDELSPKEIRH